MMLCTTLSNGQSDPSLSVFMMAACKTDLCRLGPQDTVSIDLLIAFLRDSRRHGNRPHAVFPTWLTFHG